MKNIIINSVNKYIVKKTFTQGNDINAMSNIILMENPMIIRGIFYRKFNTEHNKLLLLIILCYLVYKHQTGFYEILETWGQGSKRFNIHNIDSGDLVYSTFYFDNTLVIAFKGSTSIEDFLIDCHIVKSTDIFLEGKIHSGFHGLITKNSRHIDIINLINEYPKDTKIIFTGHSLGAAIATLMTGYTQDMLGDRVELVTFGSPRLGNSEFSKSIKKSTRCVNRNDAVSKLPLPINFSHIDKKFTVGKTSMFKFSLLDHLIESYYITFSRLQCI